MDKVRLDSVALLSKGTTITAKNSVPGEIPVIAGGKKPAYFHNEANRKPKCVTVSASGAYAGFVAYHHEPIFASDCTTLEPLDSTVLSPKYLYYFLASKQEAIYGLQRGSGMPHVYAKDLAQLEIPMPSHAEQQRIVATLEDHLSRLDKALAEVESSISRLREARLSWLQAEMAHLYDEGSLVQLSEVAESRLGKMLDAAKNVGVSTPYLRNINVQWGRIDCLDLDSAPMTQANLDELGLQLGDLLVCEGGEPGRCAIWTESHQTLGLVAFQKALHRVRAKAGYSTGFLALILEWHAKSGRLTPFITGTTIKHLPQEQLRKIPVPVIPLEQQRSLVAKYGTFIESQASIQSTLDKVKKQIRALKGSLLNLAFEGGLKD